jgi:hypothetical protein
MASKSLLLLGNFARGTMKHYYLNVAGGTHVHAWWLRTGGAPDPAQ